MYCRPAWYWLEPARLIRLVAELAAPLERELSYSPDIARNLTCESP